MSDNQNPDGRDTSLVTTVVTTGADESIELGQLTSFLASLQGKDSPMKRWTPAFRYIIVALALRVLKDHNLDFTTELGLGYYIASLFENLSPLERRDLGLEKVSGPAPSP